MPELWVTYLATVGALLVVLFVRDLRAWRREKRRGKDLP